MIPLDRGAHGAKASPGTFGSGTLKVPWSKSLGLKLCTLLGVAIGGATLLFFLYFLGYETRALRDAAEKELVDLTGIVLRNTKRSMQANHPEGTEDIIRTVGEQKNILSVRIYTRYGAVRYRGGPQDPRAPVGVDAPTCVVCHRDHPPKIPLQAKDMIFEDRQNGTRAIAIVAPIFGERSCYEAPCHVHPQEHKLLGVLEIRRSLEDLDEAVRKGSRRLALFGLGVFILTASASVFFVLRAIYRPVSHLVQSASRISQGDYGAEIDLDRQDELGELTRAFNHMSRSIQERERKLFQSREEFRTLFDEVPALILVLDRELRISKCNKLFREVLGERVGEFCFQTWDSQNTPCTGCPAIRCLEDGGVWSIEQTRRLPSGKKRTFLIHAAPLKGQTGQIEAVMEILTDITPIKELQRELVLLGETVAGISHTIKNILGGLEGGIYVVDAALGRQDAELLGKGWNMVKGNVARISKLVRDILYLSKERKPVREEVDPQWICKEVVELASSMASQAGVALELESTEPSRTILVDPMGIHSVLMDLVTNAIEACQSKPGQDSHKVTVRCTFRESGETVLEVRDTGPGIPEEIRDKLFVKSVTTKGSKGTGLGLLVAKKIVDEHGGSLEVESIPGKGSTFRVVLPVLGPDAQFSQSSPTAQDRGASLRNDSMV